MRKTDIEQTIEDSEETIVRDLLIKAGLNTDLAEKAIKDYKSYMKKNPSSLSIITEQQLEEILADNTIFLKRVDELLNIFSREALRYLRYKIEIVKVFYQSKDWNKVMAVVAYSDVNEAHEAFMDYVEEIYQTKIKDAKHLQKITGITEHTLEGLANTFLRSKYSKYLRATKEALRYGAKYKDLLEIKPQQFGLLKTWSGCLGSDQYTTILWAITMEFFVHLPDLIKRVPDLRSIANEIKAPYSVLMDSYNLMR